MQASAAYLIGVDGLFKSTMTDIQETAIGAGFSTRQVGVDHMLTYYPGRFGFLAQESGKYTL